MNKKHDKVIKPDVSIIVNAHNEGLLLHKTLKSLAASISKATTYGLLTEVIIVADRADSNTKEYLDNRLPESIKCCVSSIEYVNFGDLGLSRNHGIDLARGEFVGNLDGDDLWSDNWITEAVKTLRLSSKNIIVHHAAVLNFGTKNGVWHIRSSLDPSFNPRSIIEDNWWPSCMMTQRSTFDRVKYQKVDRGRSFSFEDWLFNSETLAEGIEHIVVPETTFFYRRKDVSMLTAHISGLPTPNKLFTPAGLAEYLTKREPKDIPIREEINAAHIEVAVPSRDTTVVRKIAISGIKKSGRFVVRSGKKYLKPHIDSRHRLKRYLKDIKAATHTLIADGNDNLNEGRKKIPGWLRNQWYQANEIEPHLFPTHNRILTAYNRSMMTMGPEQDVYWKLMNSLADVDYIIVLPYVRRAGAYMVGLHYAKAYKELHQNSRVVVLTTENTYESIPDLIPEGVDHVHVPDNFFVLSKQLKQRVLAKVFTNAQPQYVHVVHSQEAFQALQRYPAQISLKSKIILSTFNYDYTTEGQRMNAFLAYGQEILPYVHKIFTDNEWVAADTVELTGITSNKVEAHAMPVKVSDSESSGVNLRSTDGKMRILWAARMAKQKRPDILYEIAKFAQDQKLPYEFVVYGEVYDKVITQSFLNKLVQLKNVQYRGAFHNGIQALPTGEFEVYLSTSEAEGTPNAILEAQERGLVVVAPNLGGIPEAIRDRQTGLLVEDFSDINAYIEAFKFVYEDQKRSKHISEKGREQVRTDRSWDTFKSQFSKSL